MNRNRFHPVWMITALIILGFVAIIYFLVRDIPEETVHKPDEETAQRPEDPNAREPEDDTAQELETDQPAARNVVLQFIEAYNSRDTTTLKSLLADPVAFNGEEHAPDIFIRNSWVNRLWKSFPDARIEPTHFVATDEYVTLRTESEVTGQGTFMGFDVDSKTIRISEMSLYRVENGKITEWWYEIDMLKFWEQLGHIKDPLAHQGLPAEPGLLNSPDFQGLVTVSGKIPLD